MLPGNSAPASALCLAKTSEPRNRTALCTQRDRLLQLMLSGTRPLDPLVLPDVIARRCWRSSGRKGESRVSIYICRDSYRSMCPISSILFPKHAGAAETTLRQWLPGVRLTLMFQGYEEPFGRDAIENIVPIGQLESQIPMCLFWTLSRHFARRDGGADWRSLDLGRSQSMRGSSVGRG